MVRLWMPLAISLFLFPIVAHSQAVESLQQQLRQRQSDINQETERQRQQQNPVIVDGVCAERVAPGAELAIQGRDDQDGLLPGLPDTITITTIDLVIRGANGSSPVLEAAVRSLLATYRGRVVQGMDYPDFLEEVRNAVLTLYRDDDIAVGVQASFPVEFLDNPGSPLLLVQEQRKVSFDSIEFDGVTRIGEASLDALASQFVNKPGIAGEIATNVSDELLNLYQEQGYWLVRVLDSATRSRSDGAGAILTIRVVEGSIERIDIFENDEPRVGAATPFWGLEGDVFNLRDIEQGLEQINRLATKNAIIDLKPGSSAGLSIVEVCTDTIKPWSITGAYDNSGAPATGRSQAEIIAQADDVLGLYDAWYLSVKNDAERNEPGVSSQNIYGGLSVPFGYWTTEFTGYRYKYVSTLEGAAQDFQSKGEESYLSGELKRVIFRDDNNITEVGGADLIPCLSSFRS